MNTKHTRRGFTQIKHGGFTLIELLVVVLIIGTLVAVAVPQYQKAVGKSRFVQTIIVTRTIYNSALQYYLANGVYPTSKANELDISIGRKVTGSLIIINDDMYCVLEEQRVYCATNKSPFYSYHLFYNKLEQCCSYKSDNNAADALCASQLGKKINQWRDGGGGAHCFQKSF